MTGINQGTPETAIGEPIRLGSNNEFEIEQHPVSDRLIIRDTVNGKVAYVRKERNGQIGGDGVLVKALKEGKPVADDGRTHNTIQAAERAASGWVFIPPGTFNESVEINTDGLTLRGSGYNTLVDGDNSRPIIINSPDVSVRHLSVRNNPSSSGTRCLDTGTDATNGQISNVFVRASQRRGITVRHGSDWLIHNCTVANTDKGTAIRPDTLRTTVHACITKSSVENRGVYISSNSDSSIVSNCVLNNDGTNDTLGGKSNNSIYIGNRGVSNVGFTLFGGTDNIVANNRVNSINDGGTNTLLDANLTGASN